MRVNHVATATTLTALLLTSLLLNLAVELPPQPSLSEGPTSAELTSGRSTSPEVFLAGGGSSTHDEFSGAIASTDNGWVIAGDVNSSAASLVFGTQTYVPTSPYSNGNDFFVASMDSTGAWNYISGADHTQGGVSFMSDVASHAGNAIVSGYMYGPLDFGQISLNTAVQFDGFIAQTDATGNWIWAKGFQTLPNSSTDSSIPQAITVDQVGDVIVAGYFSGETDFGGTSINVSNAEIFIAKLDGANGALKWVVSGGGIGNQQVTDVVVDNAGNIFVSGITQNNVLFGTNSYNILGTQDSFVVKVSSTGAFLALTGYGIANQAVSLTSLAMDGNGDLYAGVPMKERWPRTDGPSRPTKVAQICSSSRKVRLHRTSGLPRVAAMQLMACRAWTSVQTGNLCLPPSSSTGPSAQGPNQPLEKAAVGFQHLMPTPWWVD